jgi:hypothetical protein
MLSHIRLHLPRWNTLIHLLPLFHLLLELSVHAHDPMMVFVFSYDVEHVVEHISVLRYFLPLILVELPILRDPLLRRYLVLHLSELHLKLVLSHSDLNFNFIYPVLKLVHLLLSHRVLEPSLMPPHLVI